MVNERRLNYAEKRNRGLTKDTKRNRWKSKSRFVV